MPRPRPPRKRPRRRPDAQQRVLRAEAALAKQTAQSTQQKQPPPAQPDAPRGAGAAAASAPAPADEPWSRRSYAVMVAIIAVLQLPITVIQWAVQPAAARGPVQFRLLTLEPISLLIAALFSAPIAKLITRETRTLRFMETLVVGVVIYFLWLVLVIPAGTLASTTPAPPTSTTHSSSVTTSTSTSTSRTGSSTSTSTST